jgi:hypothetical protein
MKKQQPDSEQKPLLICRPSLGLHIKSLQRPHIYMVSFIQDEKSVDLLMLAAQSNNFQVRLAAADAARHLRFPEVEQVLNLLVMGM